MKNLNRVILIGHVGRDPQQRATVTGKMFLPVSVATNASWKDKDGNVQEQTEWHDVMFWGDQFVSHAGQMLIKGTPVFIEGRLRTYSQHDPMHDVTRYKTVIIAENFIVLRSKPSDVTNDDLISAENQQRALPQPDDDDLPF